VLSLLQDRRSRELSHVLLERLDVDTGKVTRRQHETRSENLLLVTDGEHSRIHDKEHRSSVQLCPRCYSYDTVKRGHNSYYRVRRGAHNITECFLCRNCKRTFVHLIEVVQQHSMVSTCGELKLLYTITS
jgi:hypothetical protein